MRLSLSHNFLFVHIPKTAGMSLSIFLEPYLLKPELNQYRRLLSHLPVRESPEHAWLRPHLTAAQARWKLGGRVYDGFYKFAVVRNPFDVMVSRYEFIRQLPRHHRYAFVSNMTFPEFVRYEKRRQRFWMKDQSSFVLNGQGNLIVDDVYRFENLDRDLHLLCDRIGIEPPRELPEFHRTKRKTYPEYYGETERDIVARIYARDIERFGYAF